MLDRLRPYLPLILIVGGVFLLGFFLLRPKTGTSLTAPSTAGQDTTVAGTTDPQKVYIPTSGDTYINEMTDSNNPVTTNAYTVNPTAVLPPRQVNPTGTPPTSAPKPPVVPVAAPTPVVATTPPPVTKPTPQPTPAPSAKPPYVVRSGDTLWGIAQSRLGSGNLWQEIYNANTQTIESTAQAHGLPNSGNGHWIYPGEVLHIP